jgi:hypothetical protein
MPGSPATSDPFTVRFDENGNGTVSQNGGPFRPLLELRLPDPLNGFTLVPTFFLPELVITGDLRVTEPGGTLSDIVRFPDLAGTGRTSLMMYYSDNTDRADSLSDVGLPARLQNVLATVAEVGPEGNNRFRYVAGSLPFANTYLGISDTPEPTTLVLALLGAIPLTLLASKSRGPAPDRGTPSAG